MVLVANSRNGRAHYWAGRFPGRVGWLFNPDTFGPDRLRPWMPYALDNGAWGAHLHGAHVDTTRWSRMVALAASQRHRPMWAVVPDVVGDHEATLESWSTWVHVVTDLGLVPAFAAQDGCEPEHVPADAGLVFMGGTTRWKWQSLPRFAAAHRRVHVGRVNTPRRLRAAMVYGAESVDGTGYFRGGWHSWKADMLEHVLASPSLFPLRPSMP